MALSSLDGMHGSDRPLQVGLPFTLDVVDRYLGHPAQGTTDAHPDGPRFRPRSEYLDPEIHRRDVEMQRRTPLVAAHCSQLPNPSDFHTEQLLGVPVLLVRQKDGQVKAFLNSCIHRGARP